MNILQKATTGALLGTLALFSSASHASLINDPNAGFAATVFDTSIVGADLNSASSISFAASNTWITTSVPPTYTPSGGVEGINDMVGKMTNFVTTGSIANINIDSFSAINNFMTWTDTDGDAMSFDLTTLVRNTTASGAMDLFGSGIFHYIDVADSLVKTTAASFRLTAQDVGGNISSSFSWGTPPFQNDNTSVPLPGVLGLMAIGLLGFASRRKLMIG